VRSLSKVLVIAVGLLAFGLSSSSAGANDVRTGKFSLPHPTRWNNAVLPAGNYTFKLKSTKSNAETLVIHGSNLTMSFLVYPDSACANCQDATLNLAVRGNDRIVTSMDVAGFRMTLNPRPSAAAGEQEAVKSQEQSEQVTVQFDPN
jgi:hypothetical protein